MSLDHCAETVEQGDPDRFLAAMACPPKAREILFPLYAMNMEIARAPWVTAEPMIAEMRLQFWRDVMEDITAGKSPRKHPVAETLSPILTPSHAQALDRLIAARRWDIYKDPFEDAAHFDDYIMQTSGTLMWVAADILGATLDQEHPIRATGYATGLARFFQAVPDLEKQSRIPLIDGRINTVAALAATALKNLPKRPRNPACKESWMTETILKQVVQNPTRVAEGSLGTSGFSKKLRLLLA